MITTVLFDFDGVITNTEPQYDAYFNQVAKDYGLGIDNFAAHIKGVPMAEILRNYFGGCTAQEIKKLIADTHTFESHMQFTFISGVRAFIQYLEENNYKIAIVTSSQQAKMDVALAALNLKDTFKVVVTADDITKGKPDPMCYLLAANRLQSTPAECLVFEDSLAGITAGKNAAMRVVGVATTLPADTLRLHVPHVIPDFTKFDVDVIREFTD